MHNTELSARNIAAVRIRKTSSEGSSADEEDKSSSDNSKRSVATAGRKRGRKPASVSRGTSSGSSKDEPRTKKNKNGDEEGGDVHVRHCLHAQAMRAGGWRKPVSVSACPPVDLQLPRGKTLAIVGESGSGKTTCARIAMGAERPDAGGEVLQRRSSL